MFHVEQFFKSILLLNKCSTWNSALGGLSVLQVFHVEQLTYDIQLDGFFFF